MTRCGVCNEVAWGVLRLKVSGYQGDAYVGGDDNELGLCVRCIARLGHGENLDADIEIEVAS